MDRVVAYVDGFNLYFGLRQMKWRCYYWLNVKELAASLLRKDQELAFTKYFTSRISSPPDKVKRQMTFIRALETPSDFRIYYGKYQDNRHRCPACHGVYSSPPRR